MYINTIDKKKTNYPKIPPKTPILNYICNFQT